MEHRQDSKGQFNFIKDVKGKGDKKDIGEYLSSMKSGILFVVIVAFYMTIILLGSYLGRSRLLSGIKEPESSMGTAVASVLGLLAFVLGFTFSITWTRFSNRNSLIIQHAKAIGTCYLRAGLLPEIQKLQVRKLLHEYIRILIAIQKRTDLERAMLRVSEIHILLWKETGSLVREDVDSEFRSLFIISVNELINLALERKTIALFVRIPNAIWTGLLLLALIGMLAFGYQSGISGNTKLFQLPLLPMAVGVVIVLIADLNSPDAQRYFKVTKRPLKEVLDMMEKNIP